MGNMKMSIKAKNVTQKISFYYEKDNKFFLKIFCKRKIEKEERTQKRITLKKINVEKNLSKKFQIINVLLVPCL